VQDEIWVLFASKIDVLLGLSFFGSCWSFQGRNWFDVSFNCAPKSHAINGSSASKAIQIRSNVDSRSHRQKMGVADFSPQSIQGGAP